MALGNANFDSILSTTLANYRNTLEDNVFTAQPFVAWLKAKGRIEMLDGGAKIVEQLMYAQNQAAGSFSGYDTLPLTASAGISAAEFPWKQFAATIAINGLEEAENSGDAAIINLLKAKVTQAEETLSEAMDVMFLSDGSGNTGKDWWGIKALINDFDVLQNSVAPGNISVGVSAVPLTGTQPTQNQFWQSYVDYGTNGTVQNQLIAVNGVNNIVPQCFAPATQLNTQLTQADMTHLYNLASKGNTTPDFGLAGQRLYEKYESLLTPNLRFTDTRTADGGFENLTFKKMVLMFDVNMLDYTVQSQACNSLYMLNSKYLTLKGHSDNWFVNTDFVKPPNQNARYAQILAFGNLTISNRMRHGVLLNRY